MSSTLLDEEPEEIYPYESDSEESRPEHHCFRVVVLGAGNSGKTTLLDRSFHEEEEFRSTYCPGTTPRQTFARSVTLVDCAGREAHGGFSKKEELEDGDYYIIAFDSSSRKSYEGAQYWVEQVKWRMKRILLVGTKIDLGCKIDDDELNDYADREELLIMLTSAKTGDGCEDVRDVVDRWCEEDRR